MKTLNFRTFFMFAIVATLLSSCTGLGHTMQQANTTVELHREDFTVSKQVSGTAEEIRILGIDWSRFFKKEGGRISVPILSTRNTRLTRVDSYALYDLMIKNEGYDVVLYPIFHTETLNILWIFRKTTVTVSARVGKIK
jgi:hypothetical protein